MPIHSIAVATDFSEHAKRAAHAGMALARHTGASLTLVHVDELVDVRALATLGQVPATFDALASHHRRVIDTHVEEQRVAVAQLDSEIVVKSAVRSGAVDKALPEFAGETGVDLLVIGSHGESGSLRFLFGSTAAKVSRSTPCPVFVVRPGQERFPANGYRKIIVGIDHSAVSIPCLELAANLLCEGGTVVCLHVWEEPSWMANAGGGDDEGIASNALGDAHRAEVERMDAFVGKLSGAASFESRLRRGHPASEILDEIDEGDADLVVVGTHRREGYEHIVGTVADRVLRHSKVPVALVPHYDVPE